MPLGGGDRVDALAFDYAKDAGFRVIRRGFADGIPPLALPSSGSCGRRGVRPLSPAPELPLRRFYAEPAKSFSTGP